MRRGREVALATKSVRLMPDACGGGFAFRCCSKFRTEPFCSMLQKGFDFVRQKITTRKICLLGVFAAITAILGIFATFRIGNQIKIPLKFITVFITGALFGPLSGGLVASIADILNAVLVPVGPIMPQITAVEFLYGVIYGAFFYKAKDNPAYYLRAVLCCLLQAIISITLMSMILTDVGYFSSFAAAVVIRMPAALVTLALHLLVTCGGKKLIFNLKRFISKEGL